MQIERTLRMVVLGCVFALPLIVFIVSPETLFFPFITGKNIAFRVLVEIMTGAYLALAVIHPSYRPRRSPLLTAYALLVLIAALADAFGVNPAKSFWSNFERMDGWITLVHLFAYLAVTATVLNAEKMWRRFLQWNLGVSALVSLYAFMQLFGIATLTAGFSSAQRLDATLGNPIYLAVYMLFNIGIAALLWRQEARAHGRTPTMYAYATVLSIDVLVLLLTGTRGAMIGLIGGLFIGSLLLIWGDVAPKVRRLLIGVVVGIIVLGGLFYAIREQSWVKNVPVLNRLATISLNDGTTKARFYNWNMAWQGVKERPILGWGQENYAIVFDKYYDPRMYAQEQWFDRVHNIIFDWLVAAGFLGLLSYLSLFGSALYLIWRRAEFDAVERAILTGTLLAYFIHNLFVFDNIMSYLLFTTLLAYVVFRTSAHAKHLPLPSLRPSYAPIVAGVALCAVWGVAWYVNARPLAANRTLLQALAPHSEGLGKNLEYFEKAINYGTYGTQEVREQLVQVSAQLANADVSADVKQAFFKKAADEMLAQASASPLDARPPLFLGILLDAYGDLENGAAALRRALELSPTKHSILFELGSNALARDKGDEALLYFKRAYELSPEFSDARIYYAAAAIRVHKEALADQLLAPLIAAGNAADPRIAAAYAKIGRYDKIAAIWEKRVALEPKDANARFTLAAAYYGAGNKVRAIGILEDAGKLSPEVKQQADELIRQIRAGTAQMLPVR